MIRIRNILSLILVSLSLVFLFVALTSPLITSAQDYNALGNPLAGKDQDNPNVYKKTGIAVPTLIGNVVKGIVGVVGAVVFMMVVFGGLQWLLAQGNEEKITKAKKTLIWAILGLVVIFSAYMIISYVMGGIQLVTSK